jgi:nucleotide-binding universal stress UspA family protein
VALRSILVQFDADPSATHRLQVARRLAGRHGASVAAAYAVPKRRPPVAACDDGTPASLFEHDAIEAEQQRAARECFEAALRAPGPDARWIETDRREGCRGFVDHALWADLLVLGAETRGRWTKELRAGFAETVVIDSGKPAIVVPHEASTGPVGRRIVVAWKAEREAMRALTGALPLLQAADQVHLAHWSEPDRDVPDFPALERYLRLHAIEAVRHKFGRADSVGEAILALGTSLTADLLVMGCHGHARMRELVLGGVTRSVLAAPTLPVLIAS